MNDPAASHAFGEAFAAAQRLAIEGKCLCRGPCKKQFLLADLVTVQYGGAIALGICKDCFMDIDVILRRSVNGVEIRLVERQGIVLRSNG